jgi:gliding motility-associated-like protein
VLQHSAIVRVFLGLIILLSPKFVLGTHIVGGELTYQCLGNNNYQITLKLYRDCFGGQAPYDDPAIVGIFNNNQILVSTVSLNFPGAQQIPAVNISPCLTPPGNICVEEAVYQGTINLPAIAGGYHLVYQRCCRNGTVSNLISPGTTGATVAAFIPDPAVAICNNSPFFNNFPPLFLCANLPFTFDHSATDLDGDSLVYELCTPFAGGTTTNPMPNPPSAPPFPLVNFAAPYSGSFPIGSNPALTINFSNGFMTGTPNVIGQFVVGVCVSEYRNGVLIGTTKRDFQFNVVSCQGALASIVSQTVFCDGFTVDFIGTSMSGLQYFWDFGDPTTSADTSNISNPSYTYPDSGVYNVMFVAYDLSGNCVDTVYSTFQVYPLLAPTFIPPNPQCFEGNNYNFQAGGAFTDDATFNWNFGIMANFEQSTLQNPNGISYSGIGTYPVTLTVSQYGCTEDYTTFIEVLKKPFAEISSDPRLCEGTLLSFENNSLDAQTFFWDFGVGNLVSDTSNLFSPSFQYPFSGIYPVTLIAYNSKFCADTTIVDFFVFDKVVVSLPTDTLVCPDIDLLIKGKITGGAGPYTYSWNSIGIADIITGDNDIASLKTLQGGEYVITITDQCENIASDTIRIEVRPTCEIGTVNVFTPNGDGFNQKLMFKNLELYPNSALTIFNRWGRVVYESADYMNDWEGESLSEGSYYYILKLVGQEPRTGFFKLYR